MQFDTTPFGMPVVSLRQQVVSGLKWSIAGKMSSQLINWILTLMVFRLLAPSDYGLLSMATLLVSFLQLMSEAGLGGAVVQAHRIERQQLSQIFAVVLLLNVSLFLLLLLIAPLAAHFFDEPRLTEIIRVSGVQFLAFAFTVMPKAMLERAMDFRRTSMIEVGVSVLGGVLTFLFAYNGQGVWSLVWGNLIAVIVRALALNVIAPFLEWPSFSLRGLRCHFSFGGNVTADRMLWFFYSQADTLLVGKLLGKDALGIYSVSMHLATLPIQRISGIINQVAMPAFSKVQQDLPAAGRHFLKAVRLMSFVIFPIMFGMSCVAPELIGVVLGEHWADAVLPFQILTLMMPIRMIAGLIPPVAHGMGRPDISLKNLLLASVIMPIAFYVGSYWGLLGMSLAWLACFPLIFLSNLRRAMPLLELKIAKVLRAMLWAAACASCMYVVVIFVRIAFLEQSSATTSLLFLTVVGVVGYFAATWLLNRLALYEVIDLVKRR